MRIAPVSFKSYSVQQNNNVSDLSFKRREERERKRNIFQRVQNAFRPCSNIHQEVVKQDFSYVTNEENENKLKKEGFNIYEKAVDIVKYDGKRVKGAIFLNNSADQTKMRVTDDKFYTLGEVCATKLNDKFASVDFKFKELSGGKLSNVGKVAYDSLFKYLKANNHKLEHADVFLHSGSHDFVALYSFYKSYGFKELSSEGQPTALLVYNL